MSEQLPQLVLLGWYFAAGACIGSMLNVVIYRLPRRMSLWWPRSHCPKCRRSILVRDNIPLYSWLRLRGRCRWCGEPIPWRYPAVELACAVLFLAVALAEVQFRGANLPEPARLAWQGSWRGFPWRPAALALVHAGLLCGLLAAAVIAGDRFPVPRRLSLALTLLAAVGAWLFPRPEQPEAAEALSWQEEMFFCEPLGWFSLAAAVVAVGIVTGGAALVMRLVVARDAVESDPPCETRQAVSPFSSNQTGSSRPWDSGWLLLVAALMFGFPGLWLVLGGAALGAVVARGLGRRNVPAGWCWGLWIAALAVLFTWGEWWPYWTSLGLGAWLGLSLAGLGLGAVGLALAFARAPKPPPPESSPLKEKETGDDPVPPEPGPDR